MVVPLACGMTASTVAMLCTYPLNVIRTRLQASGMPGAEVYRGPFDVLKRCLRVEGWKGLFRGLLPSMFKVVPAGALSAGTYGMATKHLSEASSKYKEPRGQTVANS
jgi:solute carrier family 25 (mitochondrial phosphate transporter), member 23/24/25/41